MGNLEMNPDYKIGQDNIRIFGLDIHNPVFFISAALILLFVILTLISPEQANQQLVGARGWAIENFDWLFIWGGNLFVVFCLVIMLSPLGKIRIGGADCAPEFSRMSWFAMLFAAGMGIGLMFWSVAEPVAYYTGWYETPLNTPPNTPDGHRAAIGATMFHWGLHPWAIYAVVAVALAFFAYNKDFPLTIRSAFFPILGKWTWRWPGHFIDLIAVIATIFGLATSLGLGAQQAASGLEFLFGANSGLATQIAIIIGVTAIAVLSVMRGLEGGVKVLSNINMVLAGVLLVFVALVGQGLGFFGSFLDTTTSYVEYILPLSNSFGREDTAWFHGWTVFYWAWWISWSPFVGMFIARVSKGRTVREFIAAVLVVPTLVTMVWMTAFGQSGVDQVVNQVGQLAGGISEVSLAMFQMLENLPLTSLTSFLGIILVLVFFITSSDSGSLVIDSITAGGKEDAPVPQRVFWAVLEGVIAAVLLFGGGAEALTALQAGAVTAGLPFTLVLLAMCYSLFIGLRNEYRDKY